MNKRNTVLIIENSTSFAVKLSDMIENIGEIETITAYSFQQAAHFIAENQNIFAAISEVNVPDSEPLDSIKLLKQKSIPCIVFTDENSHSLREDVYSIGVCDYVLKQSVHDFKYIVRHIQRLHQNTSTNVLVVDDSLSARLLITKLLESQCLNVITASSGDAALEIIEKQDQTLSLVLLDLVMEGLDGLSVLKRIRKLHDVTQLAVVGISGISTREQLAKFIKYGGNDFITKPILEEEFFCRINNTLQIIHQFTRLRDLNNQKRHLISIAAHDVRSPLSAVITGISVTLKRITDKSATKFLSVALNSCNQVLALLEDLLDSTALDQPQMMLSLNNFDICQLTADVVEEMSLWSKEKGQHIEVSVSQPSISVTADQLKCRAVISNLLSNAIKYAPLDSAIKIQVIKQTRSVVMQFSNDGPSIPVEEREKLFQPYAKLSNTPTAGEKSTGLGLSICKNIMDNHNGKIRYLPGDAGGNIFSIKLPLENFNFAAC